MLIHQHTPAIALKPTIYRRWGQFFLRWGWVIGVVVGILAAGTLLLTQHTLRANQQLPLHFTHANKKLAGTLLLPRGPGPHPVVLWVHGDGPQDRGLEQYTLNMNAFLDAGFACFSWDKPGTGQSEGNWLAQTMAQRASEAAAAMHALSQRHDIQAHAIGLLGFSQGGWVLAELAKRGAAPHPKATNNATAPPAAFFITVGGALNWEQQGQYFTRMRLMRQGLVGDAAQRAIDWQAAAPQPGPHLPYADYHATFAKYVQSNPPPPGAQSKPLPAARYTFIALNRSADASAGLAKVRAPFLAVWGAQDANVDALANARDFALLLQAPQDEVPLRQLPTHRHAVKVFEGAEHKLLNSAHYAAPTPSEWTWQHSLRYLLEGEAAFSPGYLTLLPAWAKAQVDFNSKVKGASEKDPS